MWNSNTIPYFSIVQSNIMNHTHGIRLYEKSIHIYNMMLGIQETNKVCLNVGVLAISNTMELSVMTFQSTLGVFPM